MNEQILNLADQAGIAVWGDAVYMYHPTDTLDSAVLEKFAELIVRECANVGEQYADGNYEVYNQILEHFGVEEE